MSDYKLVPVEPTPEMVEAAEDAYMPFGDMELAIRMAVLATPAEQGEHVGYVRRSAIELMTGDELGVRANILKEPRYPDCVALYAAPQPAEQQPASCVGCEGAPGSDNSPCAVCGQQPAPDVAGLVEALTIARDYVFSSLEEKKLALAGYPQMWRCEQDDLAMIDTTLSTYRKETSHDK